MAARTTSSTAIRSERQICREVQVNLAYRWFCDLGLEDAIPDHSAFSRARNERFRESDIFRRVFERVVSSCDITDPFAPREVAHFVPPAPEKMVDPRPNRPRVIQSNDVYVAPDGLMYLTDVNDGLTILQYGG
jgi:hypothetical protein